MSTISNPKISGNNIIWKRGTNNNYELYLYNGSSTIQLTDKNKNKGRNPQIFDNKVVWEHYSDPDNEIYLYDGSNTIPLTNDKIVQRNPQISGNNVVWEDYDTSSSGFGIYLYNGSAPILLSNNRDISDSRPITNFNPQISGNNVVWESIRLGDRYADSEIYLYNGSISTQLTDNDIADGNPQISGNKVVWVGGRQGNDTEIYLYDGSKIIQLSDNNWDDSNPRISDDNVVWENSYAGHVFLATRDFEPTPPPPLPPIPNNSASISIDRWWATIGDAPITVNLTATVPHDGIYILDVVDAPDGFIALGSNQGSIDQYGKFSFGLSKGVNQIPVSFKVPSNPTVEKINFRLVSVSGSLELNTMFVADHPEPDIVQDKKQLIEKYCPILLFDNGYRSLDTAERYSVPLDVENYPIGKPSWKARLESEDKNDKGLLRNGDSTTVVNLSDFKDKNIDFNNDYLKSTPPLIYASILEHPDQNVDELAINYYFHFPRSNWADYGGFNTHQGDWEGITLFLSKNSNGDWSPNRAAYAQHTQFLGGFWGSQSDGGETYRWDYLSLEEGFKPYVYVGLGGHASYSKPGVTSWTTGIEFHRGNLSTSKPQVFYLPRVGEGSIVQGGNAPEWLLFPGKWGLQNEGSWFGNDGPEGPVFQSLGFEAGERWLNPWSWADGFNIPLIAQDDEAATSVGQSVTIDVIKNDNYEGNISNFGVDRPPNTGTVKVNEEIGSFTYTPSSTILTPQDDFIYYINTPTGTAQGKVTVKIASNNDQEQPALKWSPDSSTFTKNGSASNLLLTLTSRTTNLLNEIGVFEVDDEQGTINGIAPGTPGYLEAALQRAKVVFSALNNPPNGFTTTPSRTLPLNADSHFQFYLVQNSTTDAVLNGQTSPSQVLFSSTSSFQVSNSGTNDYTLSWEDGSGNQDFADLLVQAQLTDQPQPLGSAIQGNLNLKF
jgi:beta propeller repeat protein